MPTVAEQLRHGREAMQLDVQQVADATKLKSDHVRALEEGNYDYFTAAIYLRGSVRTYANLLKLDAAELVAQLDAELNDTQKFADATPGAEHRKSFVDSFMLLLTRLNWGVAGAVIALAIIFLVANASYRAWKNHKPDDPLRNLSSGMYQPAEPAGEILPLPTNLLRHTP